MEDEESEKNNAGSQTPLADSLNQRVQIGGNRDLATIYIVFNQLRSLLMTSSVFSV